MFEDPPDAIVGDAQQLGDIPDRHRPCHFNDQCLNEQSESASWTRPGNGHQANATAVTGHTRHSSNDEGLVLEEVHVPPPLLLGVVNGALRRFAFRALEPRPFLEINVKFK